MKIAFETNFGINKKCKELFQDFLFCFVSPFSCWNKKQPEVDHIAFPNDFGINANKNSRNIFNLLFYSDSPF